MRCGSVRLSDDLWPDSPRLSPLVPVALMKAAGVALVGSPQAEARISRITSRLLQSAPLVSLSLARRTDDEREQRWSPCFTDFRSSVRPSKCRRCLHRDSSQRTSMLFATPLLLRFSPGKPPEVERRCCRINPTVLFVRLRFVGCLPERSRARTKRWPPLRGVRSLIGAAIDLGAVERQCRIASSRPQRIVEAAVDEAMARELHSSSDEWSIVFANWNASALSRCLPNG